MYSDILWPVDLNHTSSWEKALPTALAHCRAFGAQLHVMTVVPDFGMAMVGTFFPDDFAERAQADAASQLDAFAGKHIPEEIASQHHVGHGTVYEEILRVAREIDADLILMASHRSELSDYLLGPNAARVVRHFERSVLVVR